jgi:hypothetical protein
MREARRMSKASSQEKPILVKAVRKAPMKKRRTIKKSSPERSIMKSMLRGL